MNNRRDLKVVYKPFIFQIQASWFNLFNGYDIYFW